MILTAEKKDLEKKIFRHVSLAFKEDPLRILRIARLAARFFPLGFTVAEETLSLMKEMVKDGELEDLTPERVWREIEKALSEKDPGCFFRVLRQCGGLTQVWPDLDRLWGIPQPARYHPEGDVGTHTMMVLQQATVLSADPVVRFAALCHDLGKGKTPEDNWPHHYGHEEKGVSCIEAFCERYRTPSKYRDLALLTARFHSRCHLAFELTPKKVLFLLESLDALRKEERFEQFLLTCVADTRGRLGKENLSYPHADFFRQALAILKTVSAQPFLEKGVAGPKIKEKLREARLAQIAQFISTQKNKQKKEGSV